MSEFDAGMQGTAEETYDFSNDGRKAEEKLWTISEVTVEQKDNGKQLVVEFQAENEAFPKKERFWLEHSNADAQRIGRGQAKKLAIAATGSPVITASALKGSKVLATIAEDGNGFDRLKNYKAAPREAEPVL